MLLHRRVEIDTDNDAAGVNPGRIREADGSGRVERRERAIVQQKRVGHACGIRVCPYDGTRRIISSGEGEDGTGEINRGERPLVKQIPVGDSPTIGVGPHNCTRRINRAGLTADRARGIETGESTVLGHDKAVVCRWVAGSTAGRVGAGKSRHFTRWADTRKRSSVRTREVDDCELSAVENETVTDAARIVVAAYDLALRTDEVRGSQGGARRIERCCYAMFRQREAVDDAA